MPKICKKGGPLGLYENPFCCKKLKGGPFGIKKIPEKSHKAKEGGKVS